MSCAGTDTSVAGFIMLLLSHLGCCPLDHCTLNSGYCYYREDPENVISVEISLYESVSLSLSPSHSLSIFIAFDSETGSWYVAQAGLKLTMCLPHSPGG